MSFRHVPLALAVLASCSAAFAQTQGAEKAKPHARKALPANHVAQNGSESVERITVSATRRPTPVDDIGTSVTVITAQEIQQLQRRTLPDLLENAPGMNVVRTGGPGGATSIFMRGLPSNAVKVRLDGMEVNDPSAYSGAFDAGQYLTDGIGRVEILRGPQSGLYGADALAGVIDITSVKGKGRFKPFLRLEGGQFGTFNQTLGATGAQGAFHYAVFLSHSRVVDVPNVPKALRGGRDVPGSRNDNRSANIRLGYDVTRQFDLGLTAHLTQSKYLYPSTAYGYTDAPPYYTVYVPSNYRDQTDMNLAVVRGTAHLASFDGRFEQILGVGYVVYRNRSLSGVAGSTPTLYSGGRFKVDWHGTTRLGRFGSLLVGAEHIRDMLTQNDGGGAVAVDKAMQTEAGYGQYQGNWRHILYGAANIRFDSNSRYGQYVTWRVAPAIHIPQTGTVLKASGGSGFRGPSLEQLFVSYPSAYGNFLSNPNLRAERLNGYDAGVEQALLGGKLRMGATWYENFVRNIIETGCAGGPGGCYDTSLFNVSQAETHGVESFVKWTPRKGLDFALDYTWTVARNTKYTSAQSAEVPRIPHDKISFVTRWDVTPRLNVASTLLWVSHWRDLDRFGVIRNCRSTCVRAPGYFTINLAASYKINRMLSVYARADNLLNRQYQNPVGYLQPGRAGYGGFTLTY
ncbi:TonB-dependent receptor plug domain-containing protein [Acidomonas methanolica]|uniref:TonB-dependent ferrichrome siderophore receptor n=1 Tax=Acidomonas methanolica NBRC 104435 TaxID=1231351 RepID=A0A023D7L2_ACIMT|nr:TonB-dependent receptor [Acidomonas methanolica]MBU2655227.1 TonB-dependent receptor [Acidomonas methanolica]TCS25602.1 vitamin B12 transporter [Acidomonas methanolica]GAJ30153.1 TonB-dependent ferrichrome siderophore receptor [Acidomonas methanolica NBRC 104435]GBQ55003.1 TonB-dependent ferrichrome siderophore receptor [Acidomonas methanolica]GEK98727.1 TonB-dependent receptor [Acidomonas methanolica NBRC 104435]